MGKTLLLVSPPVLHGQDWWANRIANKPHLSSLAGYVRDLVRVVTIELDTLAGVDIGPLLAEVTRELAPGHDVAMVGLSCWTSLHYLGTVAVAEHVRSLAPDVPIVVGGHHPTALPGDFDLSNCDFLVRGDGEHALRRLCLELPKRPDAMKVIEGGVFDQSDLGHIDWANYGRGRDAHSRALWLGTSRGCAFKCRFCIEPERGASYSRYEPGPLLDVIEGLVATHAPKVIAFSDPLFGHNRRWLDAFLDGLEERALPLLFWCETRVDLMTTELLERFRRCDFMVDFGLDTASLEMIPIMAKAAQPKVYLERARHTLSEAAALGLHHGIYLLFNFPGETPDTQQATQRWIEALGDHGGAMTAWLSTQTFFFLPGTDSWRRMAENAERYGARIGHPDWWRRPENHYLLATDNVPSRAWDGRESQLMAFRDWNADLNIRWSARYPVDVNVFRYRFFGG